MCILKKSDFNNNIWYHLRLALLATKMTAVNLSLNSTIYEPTSVTRSCLAFMAAITLLGNFFVVFLFLCRRQWLSQCHNRAILSLAIADILTACGVILNPHMVLSELTWGQHSRLSRQIYCKFLYSNYFTYSLGMTSMFIGVVLALERWLAVTKTIFYKKIFSTKHMNVLILVAWLAGFVVEAPAVLGGALTQKQGRICQVNYETISLSVALIMYFVHCLVPFTTIVMLYVDIFRTLQKARKFAATARAVNTGNFARMRKITRMTAITSFFLILTWMPGQTYFLLGTMAKTPEKPWTNPNDPVVNILGPLVFSNSLFNPFIYVLSNPVFKKAIVEIFGGFFKRCNN